MFINRGKSGYARRVVSLLFALVLVLSISTCAWADTTIFDTDYGTIATGQSYDINYGTQIINYGIIGKNAAQDPNNDIFPYIKENNGEVILNEGNIFQNYSTVVTNTATDGHTISDNHGTVSTNKGFIEYNYGLVVDNIEDGHVNYNEGEVTNNKATIYCNLGPVINNEGSIVLQFYPVYGKDLDTDPEDLLEPHDNDEEGEYIRTHSVDRTPYLLGMEDGEYSEDAKAYLNVNIPEGMELYLESGEAKIEKDEDGKLVISQIRGPVTLALRQIPAPEDPPVPAPADKTVSTPAPAVPATADNSNLPLWSGLFILFAAAVVLSRKKKA